MGWGGKVCQEGQKKSKKKLSKAAGIIWFMFGNLEEDHLKQVYLCIHGPPQCCVNVVLDI